MHRVAYPLLITFAVQCVTAFGMAAVPVLIPALAEEVGVSSGFAGAVTATVYAGAIVTAYLGSARVEQIGAIRSFQTSLVIAWAGLALCAVGKSGALLLGALVIGLGVGPVTAASTSLLTRFTPSESYGLVFSINRISVPAGAALAAVVLPILSQRIGWKVALLAGAGSTLLLALLLQWARTLDRGGASRVHSVKRRAWLEPLRMLFGNPRRRMLAKAALVFFAAQSCLASFTVTFLVDAIRLPYVQAGAVLAAAQVAGVSARLVLGVVSDRTTRRMALSGWIGVLITLATGLAALAQPGWPPSVLMAIFLLYGAGALGWNGVVLAELAHSSPRERAGEVVGTFSAVSFVGAILGPMLFSALLSTVGYAASYGVIAVVSLVAAIALFRFERLGAHPYDPETLPTADHVASRMGKGRD